MSDREILRKYINLDYTCLTEDERGGYEHVIQI